VTASLEYSIETRYPPSIPLIPQYHSRFRNDCGFTSILFFYIQSWRWYSSNVVTSLMKFVPWKYLSPGLTVCLKSTSYRYCTSTWKSFKTLTHAVETPRCHLIPCRVIPANAFIPRTNKAHTTLISVLFVWKCFSTAFAFCWLHWYIHSTKMSFVQKCVQ